MNRKLYGLAGCVLGFALLCGCGGDGAKTGAAAPSAPPEELAEETAESAEPAGPDYGPLSYTYGDCTFGILDEAGWVLDALGEPFDTFTAESCAYQGEDCFYYYDGIEVTVNEIEGVERITGITLADDTVKNPQGVYIGQSIDDALECMKGVDYTENGGVYTFAYGSTLLLLQTSSDGSLSAISYTPAES